jgi:hypothetical protein
MASAPDPDMPVADPKLALEAAYGKLPFDQFVLVFHPLICGSKPV